MNKDCVRETMLALTKDELEHASDKYARFLAGARVDSNEPIEIDEQAQAKWQADLAESFEQPVHSAEEKLAALGNLDFGPKAIVEPGAIVCIDGRHFVIGVSTGRFTCEGTELMGLSPKAPFYEAIEGLAAGDDAEFRGREFEVRAIY